MGGLGSLGDYIASIAGRVGHSRPVGVVGIAGDTSCSGVRENLIVGVLAQ